MPDIYGGEYYGGETYVETAPGGAWDAFIGYDTYAPGDGYLTTEVNPFDAPAETVEWGGGSDPYQSPITSTSDYVRSREAGIPYPSSPINAVPQVEGTSTERGGIESLFKPVVEIFGKAAITFAGTLGAIGLQHAAESLGTRDVPGRPISAGTLPGAPHGLPARPYPLPSFLGGGTFTPTSSNILLLVIGAAVAFFVIALAVSKK